MKPKKQIVTHLVEEYQIEIQTKFGRSIVVFKGNKNDIEPHFNKMNTIQEPLKIIKINE
jgi:hypothetical protein